jgi:hypothetical protein
MTQQSPQATTLSVKLAHLVDKYKGKYTAFRDAHEKAKKVLPAGNTRSVLHSDPFPLVVRSAEGSKITTIDGVTLEDFVSDFSAGIYGTRIRSSRRRFKTHWPQVSISGASHKKKRGWERSLPRGFRL